MSEVRDMYDRFFRGSKYERKWLRREQLTEPAPHAEPAIEPPRAAESNPFDRPERKEVA